MAENLRLFFDHGRDVLFRYRLQPSPHFEFVTPGIERLTGYSADEHLWDPSLALASIAPAEESLRGILNSGPLEPGRKIRLRIRHRDSRTVWAEIVVDAVMEDGVMVALKGVGRDVTDVVAAEEAARETQLQFQSLADHLPHIVARFDSAGRHLYVNRRIEAVSGLSRSEFLGRTNRELGMPENLVRLWNEALESVFRSGRERRIEFAFGGVNGERQFEGDLVPELDADGRVASVLSITRDVTERLRAIKALQNSEVRFRTAFEMNPDWITVSDPETGRFVMVNEAFCIMSGWSRDDVVGRTSLELNMWPVSEQRAGMIELVRREGRIKNHLVEVVRRDGTIRYGSVNATFIEWDGRAHLLAISRDVTDMLAAQKALSESEERFRSFFENTAAGIVVTDANGRLLMVNRAFADMLGYEVPEMIGRSIRDLAHPDQNHLDPRVLADLGNGTLENLPLEKRYLHKDGRIVWAIGVASTIRTGDGKPPLFIASVQDVTELKTAREILRREHERQLLALQGGDLGYCEFDITTGGLRFDTTHGSLLGFTLDELPTDIEGWYQKLIHPDDRKALAEAVNRHLRGETDGYARDHRVVRPDGSALWVHSRGRVVDRGPNGEPLRMIAAHLDISRLKLAETALEESRQRLELALHGAQLSLWDLNFRDETAYYDEHFAKLIGIDPAELEGHLFDWAGRVHPDDWPRIDRALLNHITGIEDVYESEHRLRHADGRWRWILSRGKVVERGEDGIPIRMIGTNLDITERKTAEMDRERFEERLRQSRKLEAVGRLAGGVAHEFNNLLTGVSGYIEMAASGLPAKSAVRDDLNEAKKAVDRAAALTQQLLAFSRRQMIEPRVLDLNQHIEASRRVFSRLLGENIRFSFEPLADLWPVWMDPGQADQVFILLLSHARDALRDGGSILLRTENIESAEAMSLFRRDIEARDYVLVTLQDTGPGMQPAELERLFEPFSKRGLVEGGGLDLPTVYGIVRQNHGFIEADSRLRGGTVFRILLPRHDEEAVRVATADERAKGPDRGTILLVEDEDVVRVLAKRILEQQGYEVLVASNGEAALTLASEAGFGIDLLLTDVVMPGINGRVLADRLREMIPGVRVVYMSGYDENVIAHHGVLEGDAPFLPKPFDIEALLRIVRDTLAGEGLSRS